MEEVKFINYYQSCIGQGKTKQAEVIQARGNDWKPPTSGLTGKMSEADFKQYVKNLTPGRIIVGEKIIKGWFMAVNLFVARK